MKMYPTSNMNKKRMVTVFVLLSGLLLVLTFRVGWIQVVKGNHYTELAKHEQKKDIEIEAKRGSIYDCHGQELAISAVTNTIWARPAAIKSGRSDKKAKENYERTRKALVEVLKIPEEKVDKILESEKPIVKVAKYIDKTTADQLRQRGLKGIEIEQEVKRYYPMGALAANVLGSVTDDNVGQSGLEAKYNSYLAGVPGRWIKDTDRDGQSIVYGKEEYHAARNGYDMVSTIDKVIQHITEKAIENVRTTTAADRVMGIVMNPKNGDILAMAVTPDFDPNNPRTPIEADQRELFNQLNSKEKYEYLMKMWRNPMINDVYEPGSTFKLITTSAALEEGVTNLNDHFYCSGTTDVYGTILKCWSWQKPHGAQTLTQALGNSCNPVFIQLAQRIGYNKYYDYLDRFGITSRTGIDFPGEGKSILQPKKTAGPVGLATMSYGQGIAVTPIQMVTAVSAIGNGGELLEPHLIKRLIDKKTGKIVKEFDKKLVRKVISEQTSKDMRVAMEHVVLDGGGKILQIPGYRIGGKTGTAQKAKKGKYENATDSSVIAMAPIDDPQLTVLVIVDHPKGIKFGSTTAGPGVKQILSDCFTYLNIKPSGQTVQQVQVNNNAKVTMPNITGMNFMSAAQVVVNLGLTYGVEPKLSEVRDFTVVDQYPKPGVKIGVGQKVFIYRK